MWEILAGIIGGMALAILFVFGVIKAVRKIGN